MPASVDFFTVFHVSGWPRGPDYGGILYHHCGLGPAPIAGGYKVEFIRDGIKHCEKTITRSVTAAPTAGFLCTTFGAQAKEILFDTYVGAHTWECKLTNPAGNISRAQFRFTVE